VFFVRAESPELLRSGVAELAPVLGLAGSHDEDVLVEGVLHGLKAHPGWLLILDNVDDEDTRGAVKALLPELAAGRVLITSRLKNWPGRVQRIPLGTLAPEEAVAFLLERAEQRMPTADEEKDAAALAGDLGYLPLALEQAAAFVDVHGESFERYRQRLKEESGKVLEWYDPEVMEYPRSIATTWQPSFYRLGPSARILLHLVAFLAPEGIPRGYFGGEEAEAVLKGAVEDFDLDEAIRELTGYSFLQVTEAGFGVHRMVQEVVRGRLDGGSRTAWVARAVDFLNASEPGDPLDAHNWSGWRLHRPHAERVIRQAWDAGIRETNLSQLMRQTGMYLRWLAVNLEAETLYRRALEIDEASFGDEHPAVARDLNNLAMLLQATNRLQEAEPLMRRALEIDEAIHGDEHPDVAIRLNNLGLLLKATNRISEAEPLMRRALEIGKAIYGDEHPRVAQSLNSLAHLLQATNRLQEAEPLMRRALEIDETIYGDEHPRVAIRLNNLATLLQSTNRFSEAESLMRRALEIDEASYGGEHPDVAFRLNNLGLLLKDTHQLDEAIPLMERAVAIFETSLVEGHPNIAIVRANLAAMRTKRRGGLFSFVRQIFRRLIR
jgi:tetratricopeptide (TPR) repeat protein